MTLEESQKEVLMEEETCVDGKVYQTVHTKEYVKVGMEVAEDLSNQLVNVQIESHLQIMH